MAESADSTEWTQANQWQLDHSSDFKGLPPPVKSRQSVSNHRELDEINHWIRVLDICTGGIENTLRLCLDASKFQNFYKIFRHIKSLHACMEH
jgi:hypothetical protein